VERGTGKIPSDITEPFHNKENSHSSSGALNSVLPWQMEASCGVGVIY